MSESDIKEVFSAPPSNNYFQPRYLKAVSKKASVPLSRLQMPNKRYCLNNVVFESGHLKQFKKVCGYNSSDNIIPISYPHMPSFALSLHMMTEAEYPFPLLGTVHLENHISRYKTLLADVSYQMEVYFDNLRAHNKGIVFEVVTELQSEGEIAWMERSVYLSRVSKKLIDKPVEDKPENKQVGLRMPCSEKASVWSIPSTIGRSYGSISGDRNPIHLYPQTAKMFGFKRHIAHGMWLLARSASEVEAEYHDKPVRLSNEFKRPVFLPGKAHHYVAPKNNGADLELWSPRLDQLHMTGSIELI